MKWRAILSIGVAIGWAMPATAQPFQGFDSATLDAVGGELGQWGLKIVVLNVGNADAILVMTPNGDVCLIDAGHPNVGGNRVHQFLTTKSENGIGVLNTIDLAYCTHYDYDHIGGFARIIAKGIQIRKAFDQGLSKKRRSKAKYLDYVAAVGDANNNLAQDATEPNFVRHRIHYGYVEHMGLEDNVEIRCVAVRGDTKGLAHDLDLDPAPKKQNENPGSIALVIRLGEFEFYTAGDQTGHDWVGGDAVEESVVASGAIPDGPDIDVLKVNHHGSDTSTSAAFVQALDPEVAVISAKFTGGYRHPKKVALKQFQDNRCYVLITGDGHDPDTGDFTESDAAEDDGFTADPNAVFNSQGDVIILVAVDGARYTVRGSGPAKTFSASDGDNQR